MLAAAALSLLAIGVACADDDTSVREELRQLREENRQLRQQLDALTHKVDALEERAEPVAVEAPKPTGAGKILLSGEGGVAFFDSQRGGPFPNSEFRVDEAKLFVDAQVFNDVYFFAELNLFAREDGDAMLDVGELYVDFENVSRLWHRDNALSIRVGRFDIPFGEEYISRDAIDNPLVAHALSDLWGVDEGVEFYGRAGQFQYVLAVQNGGDPSTRDFNSDKAVVARLGFDPTGWLHLSASAMRTGDLDAQNDFVSALWFGNGFIRALGSPVTTTKFHADLVEGDVAVRWPRGDVKAAGGYIRYDDNDAATDNRRDVYYYYVEAQQDLTSKLYAAARFSQIIADGGFPIVGDGQFNEYFFDELSWRMERLTLGLGYRWSRDLVLKIDYTFNWGRTDDEDRSNENVLGAEAAFRF